MYREVRVSRVESAGGAISGVCFAPGSRDQLRTPLSPARGSRRTVGEGRGEARNPLLLPLYPACIFNACVPLPLFSNSVSLAPSAVSLFSGHQLRHTGTPYHHRHHHRHRTARSLPIYRALISAPRITPGQRTSTQSHVRPRCIDTRKNEDWIGDAHNAPRETERERE